MKGSFLVAKYFLQQLPTPSTSANIVNVVSNAAWEVFPTLSGYSISKLALLQLGAHLAAGYPEVTTTSLHPGFVHTDMLPDFFLHIRQSSAELAGGVSVWLCTERARFLNGRLMIAEWDVDELLQKQSEIEREGILRVDILDKFGPEQFQ